MSFDNDAQQPSRDPRPAGGGPDDPRAVRRLDEVVMLCDAKSIDDSSPTLSVDLMNSHFAGTVVLSLIVFVGVLTVFYFGVVIDKDVRDLLGKTQRVDKWVEYYQVMNGFATTLIGMIVEFYFTIFIVVAAIFLRNVSWFPGDDPSTLTGHPASSKKLVVWSTKLKRLILWAFCPAVMYNLNVAITSTYISHQTVGFKRNFLAQDLTTRAFDIAALNTTKMESLISRGKGVGVLDTILRAAVVQRFMPLEIDTSICPQNSSMSPPQLPTVKELRSVSVIYGFPTRDWNADVLPFGLLPTQSFNTYISRFAEPPEDRDQLFDDFQLQSGVKWLTMYELFLQGKLLFERMVSESNTFRSYPCASSNGLEHSNSSQVCYGAVSSLHDLDNMLEWGMHNMASFMDVVQNGFRSATPFLESASTNLTVEVYELSPNLKLTSMTLDIPYSRFLTYESANDFSANWTTLQEDVDYFARSGWTEDDFVEWERPNATYDKYRYGDPRAACGKTSCVFLDKSELMPFKRGLQLMPYTANCSTKVLEYDEKFLNFFPTGCARVDNAAFLYGVGSYITGDKFDRGYESGAPSISKGRRHVVLTFGKLEWEFKDLHDKFNAKCNATATEENPHPCEGLVFDLENVTVDAFKPNSNDPVYKRVLVLGKSQLPADLVRGQVVDTGGETLRKSPVPLLSLTTRRFYYPSVDKFYEWDYLDHSKFKNSNSSRALQHSEEVGAKCSSVVHAYITMIEKNHLYMDDPRQSLYTAALFYLFQDAAVKTVRLDGKPELPYFQNDEVTGNTTLKGDLARHEIRLKIPIWSLIVTFAGLGIFILLVVLAIVCPTQRLKLVEDSSESVAQKYVRIRQDGDHADDVLDCGLKLPSGKRVNLDDYVVDSLTLNHKHNSGRKIYL